MKSRFRKNREGKSDDRVEEIKLEGRLRPCKFINKDTTNFECCKKMKFPGGKYW